MRFKLHFFSSVIMDELKEEKGVQAQAQVQVQPHQSVIAITTSDEDAHLRTQLNDQCNACCNQLLGMKESGTQCGWGNCRYVNHLVLESLLCLLLGPIVRALKYNVLRTVEGTLALAINPILVIIDLFGCSSCSCCGCNDVGSNNCCGFVWPFFPVVGARLQGALNLLGCSNKPNRYNQCQKFHNISAVIVGALTAVGGVLLSLYFLSVTLPLSYDYASAYLSDDEINDSTDQHESLLPFRPFLAFNPGQRFLVLLLCCWGLAIGWIWGKEATLNWIPTSLTNLWRTIREESVRVNIANACFRNRLGIDGTNGSTENVSNNDIRRTLKRQILSYGLEYVLCIPGSVIGILWDTMHCLTLFKNCRPYLDLSDAEFPTLLIGNSYCPCSTSLAKDPPEKENERRRKLPANYSCETMWKERIEEIEKNRRLSEWGTFNTFKNLIQKNYLRDVISGKPSSPFLQPRFTDPDDDTKNIENSEWRDYAEKYVDLHKLLKHGRPGSNLFEISRDYNYLLFKVQIKWINHTNQTSQTASSIAVATAASDNSAIQLAYPFSLLIPPIPVSIPIVAPDPIAISIVPTINEEKK